MKATFEQKRSFETNKGGHGFIWCINLLITAGASVATNLLPSVPWVFFNGVNKNKANNKALFKTNRWINVINSISAPLFGVFSCLNHVRFLLISHHFLRSSFTENKIMTAYGDL